MKELANESYGYTEDPIVSSDIVGITYGSLFDATQTLRQPTPVPHHATRMGTP